jgi:hypothetical protein
MTLDEALNQLDELGRTDDGDSSLVSQEEILCPDTQEAVRILAAAYGRYARGIRCAATVEERPCFRLRPGVCCPVDGARDDP